MILFFLLPNISRAVSSTIVFEWVMYLLSTFIHVLLMAFSQSEVRKAQKKIAEANTKKAVEVSLETAEAAILGGKGFCISRVDVGLDAAAVREAVVKVLEQKVALFPLLTFKYTCVFAPAKYVMPL